MTADGRRFRLVSGIVLAHVGVNLAHGLPHGAVPVPLADWQNLFVVVVVVGAPLAGLWMIRRERVRVGAAALLAGGLGSVLFGTYYHFFSATPDNVANVTGAWALPFLLTAVGISLLAVATAAAGWWLLRADARDGDVAPQAP